MTLGGAPLVYIIVLNWNQVELTIDCLHSLAEQDYPNFRVVVVDNGSSDGSVAALRGKFPWATVLNLPENVGYSRGNNAAISWVLKQEVDYILLLNNDTQVHAGMLRLLVEAAQAGAQVGIVGPTQYYAEPDRMIWGAENRVDWRTAHLQRGRMGELVEPAEVQRLNPIEVDYIDSCACLYKRQVFEQVGVLNPAYFINFDDVELCMRARQAGFRVMYVPAALMWHRVSAVMGQASPATTYYMTRNALLFFWSQAPGMWKLTSVARLMARAIRTSLAWSLKPQYRAPGFRRKRDANLLALRDFVLGRFDRMGADVAQVCFGQERA